ncbi:MAG TPA: helix-hairpin-helix domain-containing protein [Symbiobacteriaceae bacterium]
MQISQPVRYGVLSLVGVLVAGLVWLGVGRYQAEGSALAFAAQSGAQPVAEAAPKPEPAVPAQESPAPKPKALVVVHVTGAVVAPGVYRLETGARVDDAILAAGGALPGGAADALNRARPVADGDKIYVPPAQELNTPTPVAQAATVLPVVAESRGTTPAAGAANAKVSINTAGVAELAAVSGVGPAMAKAIVEYRTKHGPFKKLEDLAGVSGIGPKTVDKLRPLLSL